VRRGSYNSLKLRTKNITCRGQRGVKDLKLASGLLIFKFGERFVVITVVFGGLKR
jgi:hypothetical protein